VYIGGTSVVVSTQRMAGKTEVAQKHRYLDDPSDGAVPSRLTTFAALSWLLFRRSYSATVSRMIASGSRVVVEGVRGRPPTPDWERREERRWRFCMRVDMSASDALRYFGREIFGSGRTFCLCRR
jgi:hypothetical protein